MTLIICYIIIILHQKWSSIEMCKGAPATQKGLIHMLRAHAINVQAVCYTCNAAQTQIEDQLKFFVVVGDALRFVKNAAECAHTLSVSKMHINLTAYFKRSTQTRNISLAAYIFIYMLYIFICGVFWTCSSLHIQNRCHRRRRRSTIEHDHVRAVQTICYALKCFYKILWACFQTFLYNI